MTKKTEFVSLKKNSTEDDLVLRTVENYFDEEKMEEREEDMGNQGTVKNNVADLIAVFLSIMNDHKEKVDLSYEKVIDTVFKTQQREKQTFTDRLQEMTEEERKADTILKINKLGVWSKGLQKGLTRYVKETYDDEREMTEILGVVEKKMLKKNRDVNPGNFDILMEEAMEEEETENAIEEEVNDISQFSGCDNDDDDGAYDDYADNYFND
jgi:hypothetical protein